MVSKAMIVGAYQRKAEEMARHDGIDLTVLVPPRWEGPVSRVERTYTQGYDLRVVPIALPGRYHLHFYPTLAREIRRLRPDLLHIDEEPYNFATFLAYAVGRGPRRVFFSWQNIDRDYPPPFGQMERWVLRRSDGAIAGNDDAARIIRRKGFGGPLAVIPQVGVDPRVFTPLPSRPPGPVTLGFLGRLEQAKGLDDLIDACGGLRGDWRLIVAGSGAYRDRLAARVRDRGLLARVEIRPSMPSLAVPDVMRQLDIYVLPSRTTATWKEQFGRVLQEAMACAVVPVGSDSGEIPRVIGEAGLIFPEGDVTALRERIQTLIDDPGLRQRLGAAGRERVLARFTQERIAADTVDLYRRVMGESG